MGSLPDPGGSPPPSFEDFQRQASLMTSCTLLWKELSDHFSNLERDLMDKSNALKAKLQALDNDTKLSLDSLEARDSSIAKSMSIILESLENNAKALMEKRESEVEGDESDHLLEKLKGYCVKMCSKEFWSYMITKKKEFSLLRSEIPKALSCCVDPPRFVLEAISDAFPINNYINNNDEKGNNDITNVCNSYKNHGDLGWACVLLLESLIPVMIDPVLGKDRMIVTPRIKGKAEEIAETWKKSLEERGGIENVKTPDVHTFLQHLVTFGIVKEDELDFYRKLVVGSAWRKQMPKLAVALGLRDKMPDMIEELIGRGQQVDAVHFIYEVGLVNDFPPVPLLKAFLKDAKKAAASLLENSNNSGRAVHLASKKEQSAIRTVIRCIEEYKLESQFPPEELNKRLEQLEKSKIEKKKQPTTCPNTPSSSSSASKRTRASTGGPMPPAKAGRSTNASYVSSFPSPPTTAYIMSSPTHTQYPSPVHAYPIYSNRSPPYAYSPENVQAMVGSFPVSPVSFPAYGGYGNMGPGQAYQQVYY